MKRPSAAIPALRTWRGTVNLSQKALSRKLGLSHTAICQIEAGRVQPRLQTVIAIDELTAGAVPCLAWKEIVP